MKLSELIEKLQEELEKEGDIVVVIEGDSTYEDLALEVREIRQGKKILVFW